MTSKWTLKRDSTLRRLIKEGRSSGVVAMKMGFTRNAIIGRKYRLGLCDSGKAAKPTGIRRGDVFTAQEVALMTALRVARVPHKLVAHTLSRSYYSVRRKSESLGLS